MILDTLANYRRYAAPGTNLERAFRYLAEEWNPATPDGRVEVMGDTVFALPQGYETKDPATCLFESHRRYLDIQYVIDGAEAMGWAPLDGLVVTEPYDATRDIAFYQQPRHWVNVPVRVGQFTIFHPEDGHMPGLRMEGIMRVRKVVMKVLVG